MPRRNEASVTAVPHWDGAAEKIAVHRILLVTIVLGAGVLSSQGCRSGEDVAPASDVEVAASATADSAAHAPGTASQIASDAAAPEPPERHRFDGDLTGLRIETPEGEVRIEPGDGDDLLVELTRLQRRNLSDEQHAIAEQVTLVPQVTDGKLKLVAKGPGAAMVWAELVSFRIVVQTPAAWSSEASAPAGAPELRIKTRGAPVTIRRINSVLQTDTVSGHVLADALTGRAEVHTVDGYIKATDCAWYWGLLNSSGADVYAAPKTLGDDDSLHLSSSVGNLKISLPQDASCRVEVDSTGGRVLTDIPVLKKGIRYSGRSLRAVLGDGRGSLIMRSTTGKIRIELQDEPASRDG